MHNIVNPANGGPGDKCEPTWLLMPSANGVLVFRRPNKGWFWFRCHVPLLRQIDVVMPDVRGANWERSVSSFTLRRLSKKGWATRRVTCDSSHSSRGRSAACCSGGRYIQNACSCRSGQAPTVRRGLPTPKRLPRPREDAVPRLLAVDAARSKGSFSRAV